MSSSSHRNEKHWLTDEEKEIGTWGESLEQEVAEIKSVLLTLESAFSGIRFAAAAIRAKELGFDRFTVFWPYAKNLCFGMAWKDDPELVAGIEPPPDLSAGWKLDPYYGDRIRYWNGEEWDRVAAPAPGNLDLYRRIAAGDDVDEIPEGLPIHPANSHEPGLIWRSVKEASDEESDNDDEPEPEARSEDAPAEEPAESKMSGSDLEMAREIARLLAERAFEFEGHEARVQALTDFDVWVTLAGESARMSFGPDEEAKAGGSPSTDPADRHE